MSATDTVAGKGRSLPQLTQERIVSVIALALFIIFALLLDGFFTTDNLLSLVRTVAVLGLLGLGMAITIIGRGIDLSMIAVMVISFGLTLTLLQSGHSLGSALAMGMLLALLVGLLNGILIAYAQIPALFATLAMGVFVGGFGQFFLVKQETLYLPRDGSWLERVGQGSLLSVPMPVIIFLAMAVLVHTLLKRTVLGHFIYSIGDNSEAARITGVPVRPVIVSQYVTSAAIAFVAGLVSATSVASLSTRVMSSTLIYDVILVVVLGGIGLSGGKGRAGNVVIGTLLIGLLLNGMTMLDMQYTTQNLIKSLVLLVAIVADTLINPRDEQTAQAGDI